MKILKQMIRKAYANWTPSPLIRCYHYAAAFDGNKMICFTKNNPIKTSAGAYRIGENFNLPKYKEFPFYHAESHLISKLMDRYNIIDPAWSVVVMRINRQGLILGSKPCVNCNKLLDAVGLTEVFYSTDDGDFSDAHEEIIKVDDLTVPMSVV